MPRSPYGRIEDELAKAFVVFEKEYMGRGPKEATCHVIGDLVLVRLNGVLTPAEQHLAKNPEGIDLVKKMRTNLIEGAKELVYTVVEDVTRRRVVAMHTDLSTQTGERIFVFTLDGPPQGCAP
ncbi:DUF2294 domain-containing protein [Deferrisoma camini]|uniref:DUF2294 domain-containing protein n=1 Tax=Deferrisoma camini TaxID=1035120 RepID=UPI00046D8A93|nr:DUF2294 domain-containing protein [Deferrisoma camini]